MTRGGQADGGGGVRAESRSARVEARDGAVACPGRSASSPVRDRRGRLAGADRREALLDTAAAIVAAGDLNAVSMESVAERLGISRALVYKHFANRHDLLAALYERESSLLHAQLSAAVLEAGTLAEMFRVLVRGALAAQASRGATFAALASSGARRAQRDRQRRRDAETVRHFARQAIVELGLDKATATTGVALALGSLATVLARWRLRPTAEHAALCEEAFVAMAIGGLRELARRAGTTPAAGGPPSGRLQRCIR
ncbi:MAG TPA: helix-turn-helix domain-containing protein [Acidimicrobiales bacterium]|nr:helix-turn-helix domain-containing protein [Acidimicrobiales bacterium]